MSQTTKPEAPSHDPNVQKEILPCFPESALDLEPHHPGEGGYGFLSKEDASGPHDCVGRVVGRLCAIQYE